MHYVEAGFHTIAPNMGGCSQTEQLQRTFPPRASGESEILIAETFASENSGDERKPAAVDQPERMGAAEVSWQDLFADIKSSMESISAS